MNLLDDFIKRYDAKNQEQTSKQSHLFFDVVLSGLFLLILLAEIFY